jgi:peptidoglycan/xylan/chitin deacetylase (PgdA/CDA1 family)
MRTAGNIIIFFVVLALFAAALTGGAAAAAGNNRAYYRGNGEKPYVSLMINVYEGAEYIVPIMEVCERYEAKATFFVGGIFAKRNPDLIKNIYERGHELANHGYNHKDAAKLGYKENYDEIVMTERLIEAICGFKTRLFAPPSGSLGGEMFKAAAELKYDVIMWSKDTIDWRDKNPDLTFGRATKNMKNGDLILMHPTAHTLEALPRILQYFKEHGFSVVPVSVNISAEV